MLAVYLTDWYLSQILERKLTSSIPGKGTCRSQAQFVWRSQIPDWSTNNNFHGLKTESKKKEKEETRTADCAYCLEDWCHFHCYRLGFHLSSSTSSGHEDVEGTHSVAHSRPTPGNPRTRQIHVRLVIFLMSCILSNY